jgi:hypothetical protein
MAKRKGQMDKQHNGQKKMIEGQAIQWPKEKGQKDQKQNGVLVVILSLFFWSLCCLSFCPFSLVILLLVLLSLFFRPLCCLSFCPFTMAKRKGTEGPETKWPKENDRGKSNTMAKRNKTEEQATQ